MIYKDSSHVNEFALTQRKGTPFSSPNLMCSVFSLTLAQAKLLARKVRFSGSVPLLHFLLGPLLDFCLSFWYFLSCDFSQAASLAGLGILFMLLYLPSYPYSVYCVRAVSTFACILPLASSERPRMSLSCL